MSLPVYQELHGHQSRPSKFTETRPGDHPLLGHSYGVPGPLGNVHTAVLARVQNCLTRSGTEISQPWKR